VLCWVADLGKKRQLPATRCFTFKPKGGKRRTTPGFKRREKNEAKQNSTTNARDSLEVSLADEAMPSSMFP
jgi:hypothetical protein